MDKLKEFTTYFIEMLNKIKEFIPVNPWVMVVSLVGLAGLWHLFG